MPASRPPIDTDPFDAFIKSDKKKNVEQLPTENRREQLEEPVHVKMAIKSLFEQLVEEWEANG